MREVCQLAFHELGIELEWKGSGLSEQGVIAHVNASRAISPPSPSSPDGRGALPAGPAQPLKPGTPVIEVDPAYFRPTEVETLLGDPTKAREKLGWTPEIPFSRLVGEMVAHDLQEAGRESVCRRNGFPIASSCEATL